MDIQQYIDSGIVKKYLLGYTSEAECKEVEFLLSEYPELLEELEKNQAELAAFADENSVVPHASLKPLVLATFDYINRMESGEAQSFPPVLNEDSQLEDFKEWIDRADMIAPADFEEIHAKIITATPEMTCAMVWIKNMAPEEVHHDEYEKFLILEGTCTIVVGEQENNLKSGDYFAIPLYEDHKVIVTSETPCVVILQRIAA